LVGLWNDGNRRSEVLELDLIETLIGGKNMTFFKILRNLEISREVLSEESLRCSQPRVSKYIPVSPAGQALQPA